MAQDSDAMSVCNQFEKCNAPLCPIDPQLSERIWYAGEDVCTAYTYNKGHRWVKKQRSIIRRQTASWLNKPITHEMLADASHAPQMTEERRQLLSERFKAMAQKRGSNRVVESR